MQKNQFEYAEHIGFGPRGKVWGGNFQGGIFLSGKSLRWELYMSESTSCVTHRAKFQSLPMENGRDIYKRQTD